MHSRSRMTSDPLVSLRCPGGARRIFTDQTDVRVVAANQLDTAGLESPYSCSAHQAREPVAGDNYRD